MENMEEKLNSILGNPQMMQQIMTLAQNMGQPKQESSVQEPPRQNVSALPDIDPAMIGKIMGMAGKTGLDQDQKTLLKALGPYLAEQRLRKLEKAMRAAKLANLASAFLGSNPIMGR